MIPAFRLHRPRAGREHVGADCSGVAVVGGGGGTDGASRGGVPGQRSGARSTPIETTDIVIVPFRACCGPFRPGKRAGDAPLFRWDLAPPHVHDRGGRDLARACSGIFLFGRRRACFDGMRSYRCIVAYARGVRRRRTRTVAISHPEPALVDLRSAEERREPRVTSTTWHDPRPLTSIAPIPPASTAAQEVGAHVRAAVASRDGLHALTCPQKSLREGKDRPRRVAEVESGRNSGRRDHFPRSRISGPTGE
jgi:hypothetical protein